MDEIWTYGDEAIGDIDLAGYSAEAADGGVGKVDEATYGAGASYLVVDTGPWIFGKRVVLPGGLIDRIDTETETVYVSCTKDEIKNAPEHDESSLTEEEFRGRIGTYYAGTRAHRGTRL